ncbi:MAG: hypothetical protein HYY85_01905 [Deltaproteobacteria bacterium]|nr:hypothetical protein [Deltaproteobacteria bacterium]
MVDTGAAFTSLPEDLVRQIGVTPRNRQAVRLPTGEVVSYPFDWVLIEINGRQQPTPYLMLPSGGLSLLGAVTLESFAFGVDLSNKVLVSVTPPMA